MLDQSYFEDVQELYVVEKSIEVFAEVRGNSERIRIDALRHEQDGLVRYSTTAFMEIAATVTPLRDCEDASEDVQPFNAQIWVSCDIPWTDGGSADEVLNQALGFLQRADIAYV